MPTTRFEFGDIVLVPFPFTDQSAAKRRPAVVVSNAAYNLVKPDLVLMAAKPSAVKPVFTTIEQRLVLRKLGTLRPVDSAALRRVIREIVG